MVRTSAKTFDLHEYWSHTAEHVHHLEDSYYDMAWNRVSAMAEQLQTSGKLDYFVEKDKCEM